MAAKLTFLLGSTYSVSLGAAGAALPCDDVTGVGGGAGFTVAGVASGIEGTGIGVAAVAGVDALPPAFATIV